jgi:hypothetical protein
LEKRLRIYKQWTHVRYKYEIGILFVEQKGLSIHKNILLLKYEKNKIDKNYTDAISEEYRRLDSIEVSFF